MEKERGFSLIELLIVVAIIAIIAAIAVPNLLRARMAASEAAAIGNLRTFVAAETSYSISNNGFARQDALVLATPPYLDSRWMRGNIFGGFKYEDYIVPVGFTTGPMVTPPRGYIMFATPDDNGTYTGAGRYSYFVMPDGVVRYMNPYGGYGYPSGVGPFDPVGK